MTIPAEVALLTLVVGENAALKVAAAPGGWRTLSAAELEKLKLTSRTRDVLVALQQLAERSVPEPPLGQPCEPATVIRHYAERLATFEHEVVIAIAVDGQGRMLGEFEVARGGRHGAALTPADVLRPLIRAGASGGILVHNHPSGDPTPSTDDIMMTKALRNAGLMVGLPLLDHIIVAARGGGGVSLRERGTLEEL